MNHAYALTGPQCASTSSSIAFLDAAQQQLLSGNEVERALDQVFGQAQWLCQNRPAEEWNAFASEYLQHPIHTLLCQDPMTGRAFSKPRGYAGDAVMMDYLYQLGDTPEVLGKTTSVGRAVYRYVASRPSASGVRWRREHLAETIDELAEHKPIRVLAIASGHLREAALSEAVRAGKVTEFLALDGDQDSISEVLSSCAGLGVTARQATVRQILAGKACLGQYDFVYAAGLFDYLSEPVAKALIDRMLKACAPGGTVLVPNFLPQVADRGYMESFMDWHLIFRSQDEMRALVDGNPMVADVETYDDPHAAVTYLRLQKIAE